MERVRILHLRASNFVGGPERQVLRYAGYELEGPIEVIVGTFVGAHEGRQFLQTIGQRGLKGLSVPGGGLGDVRGLSFLSRYLKDQQIALICTHGYKADILGTLAGRRQSVPVACFLRGWTREDWKVRFYEAIDRAVLPFASRIVTLSEAQAKRLSHRRSIREKIRVVVNAVDPPFISAEARDHARQELRARLGLPKGCAVVATGGRLSPEKGVSSFIHAIAGLHATHPSVKFVVFGEGSMHRDLETLAKRLGVSESVFFAGFQPDFHSLLPGIDVMVNPSLSEEMPNVVLESMANAVPVVATNVGSVAEIAHGDSLILVPPGDVGAIAKAVGELLCDHDRAVRLGQAGLRRVEQAYSFSTQRYQLHALYSELVTQLGGVQREIGSTAGGNIIDHKENDAPSKLPLISIIMPVRNEEDNLGEVIASLQSQNYPQPRMEILVADGNSTDGTRVLVERLAKSSAVPIRLVPNPGQLSSAGRNVGVRASHGEIVIFIDGHCRIPSRTLLLDTARVLESTGADCLCRAQPLNMQGSTYLQCVIADARATALGHGRDSSIYATSLEGYVNPTSSGAVYRRSVFNRIGLYDESFDACEDVEFNHRVFQAGLRSYISPALTVYYEPRSNLVGLYRQLVRYGRGRVRLYRKHPDAFSFSQLVPAAFLAGIAAGGVLSFFYPWVRSVYFAALIFYAVVVAVFSAALAFRRGWRHFLLAPWVYITIHAGLGAGFWAELFYGLFRKSKRT